MSKSKLILATVTTLVTAIIGSSLMAQTSETDSRIKAQCGQDHQNEAVSFDDVLANPDGYFVASTQEQLSLNDPRIHFANVENAYFCTRSAATPEMDEANVALNSERRVVRWLFVPHHPLQN